VTRGNSTAAHGSEPTSATALFERWLALWNTGSDEAHLAFLKENFPGSPVPVETYVNFRGGTGGLDVISIDERSDTRVVATAREQTWENLVRITFQTAAAQPGGITGLSIEPSSARGSAVIQAAASEEEALQVLMQRLETFAAEDRFSGAVLVSKHGAPLLVSAHGFSNREEGERNAADTRFRIGSMNKMFTAVAVAQLAQAQKLSFSDKIAKLVPEYPNACVASRVTVAQLLMHTAGTGNIFGPEFEQKRAELRDIADYVRLYAHRALAFNPGDKHEYSNYGYIILGAIIEAVSGQPYDEYVRDQIFRPAGMNSTGASPENVAVSQRSVGYTRHLGDGLKSNGPTLPFRGTSAGGGYSTLMDLARFAEALIENRLLDEQHTSFVTTGKVGTGRGFLYGYGFMQGQVRGKRWFGHNGGAPGMNAALAIMPDAGYVIVSLSNFDPPGAQNAVQFLMQKLP
jgi:D-alanyl-D-alanine carboxypeptidase